MRLCERQRREAQAHAFPFAGETGSLRYMSPEVALSLPYNHKSEVLDRDPNMGSAAPSVWSTSLARLRCRSPDPLPPTNPLSPLAVLEALGFGVITIQMDQWNEPIAPESRVQLVRTMVQPHIISAPAAAPPAATS